MIKKPSSVENHRTEAKARTLRRSSRKRTAMSTPWARASSVTTSFNSEGDSQPPRPGTKCADPSREYAPTRARCTPAPKPSGRSTWTTPLYHEHVEEGYTADHESAQEEKQLHGETADNENTCRGRKTKRRSYNKTARDSIELKSLSTE